MSVPFLPVHVRFTMDEPYPRKLHQATPISSAIPFLSPSVTIHYD